MDVDENATPQKSQIDYVISTNIRKNRNANGGSVESKDVGVTPKDKRNSMKKVLQPITPNTNHNVGSALNCRSVNMLAETPPPKRYQRVRNPFEAALTDRLHLPLIDSPSLFQRPATPQLSSTKFEWTIEEVSSLQPENVEPHESQFQDSPDPDYEAKAQLAISSYFKEQQIVPSPVNCPLRSQRIILSELNGNTPISKPGRRVRDCAVQTELSLPFKLPAELEEALRPYFQPQLALADDISVSRSNDTSRESNTDAQDISLRRKLFDMHNIIVLDGSTTPTGGSNMRKWSINSSPVSVSVGQHTTVYNYGKLSMETSAFGSLSPIFISDGIPHTQHSPMNSVSNKSRLQEIFQDLDENGGPLSPIHPPSHNSASQSQSKSQSRKSSIISRISKSSYRSEVNTTTEPSIVGDMTESDINVHCFTPDRSSSPMPIYEPAELCADATINIKVSRLTVNGSTMQTNSHELETFANNDSNELLEVDEDEMQVSQLSANSFNCSSTNSDTPRCRRRSASRKNLSQSFSANCDDDDEDDDDHDDNPNANDDDGNETESNDTELLLKMQMPTAKELINITIQSTSTNGMPSQMNTLAIEQHSTFYRTDSGFNEMTTSSASSTLHQDDISNDDVTPKIKTIMRERRFSDTHDRDASMVSCSSTPSKRPKLSINDEESYIY